VSTLILLAGLPLERTEVLLSLELQNRAVTHRWPTCIRAAPSALIRVAGLPLERTADRFFARIAELPCYVSLAYIRTRCRFL
jgi:hypothetical protein